MNGNIGLVPGEGEPCRMNPEFISANIIHKIRKIASGDHHLVMLSDDDKIYTCGAGEQGQLGRTYQAYQAEYDERRVTRARSSVPKLSLRGKQSCNILKVVTSLF
jgi:alpha-tubulin suppressor-like RCC1 family protein